MAIVYCTTNKINGKKYIGSHNGKNSNYLGSGKIFLKAVKKYGKKNFIRQTLWEGDKEFRYEMEEYWISYFDAVKNQMFYNATEKGVGGGKGWPKGKKRGPSHFKGKKSQTDWSKVDYSNHTCKQMNTPEAIEKKRKKIKTKEFQQNRIANTDYSKSGPKISQKLSKPINQYDLEGNFIKEWPSLTIVKKQYKGDIQACCSKKQKTAGSFIWKWK